MICRGVAPPVRRRYVSRAGTVGGLLQERYSFRIEHLVSCKALAAPMSVSTEGTVKQSQDFLENAENCAQTRRARAERSNPQALQANGSAWRALAKEQDWLEGQVPPVRNRILKGYKTLMANVICDPYFPHHQQGRS